jgi:hypothetical protein
MYTIEAIMLIITIATAAIVKNVQLKRPFAILPFTDIFYFFRDFTTDREARMNKIITDIKKVKSDVSIIPFIMEL